MNVEELSTKRLRYRVLNAGTRKALQGPQVSSMDRKAEDLLTRIRGALADHTKQIQDRRRRLRKADGRRTAETLEREIEILGARLDVLRAQQKALKRGVIPDELNADEGE